MTWIDARYDGRCSECHEPIEAGDRIVYDKGKAYCADCGQDVEGDDPKAK